MEKTVLLHENRGTCYIIPGSDQRESTTPLPTDTREISLPWSPQDIRWAQGGTVILGPHGGNQNEHDMVFVSNQGEVTVFKNSLDVAQKGGVQLVLGNKTLDILQSDNPLIPSTRDLPLPFVADRVLLGLMNDILLREKEQLTWTRWEIQPTPDGTQEKFTLLELPFPSSHGDMKGLDTLVLFNEEGFFSIGTQGLKPIEKPRETLQWWTLDPLGTHIIMTGHQLTEVWPLDGGPLIAGPKGAMDMPILLAGGTKVLYWNSGLREFDLVTFEDRLLP